MSAEIVVCFFWNEHKDEKQCLKCGKLRSVVDVNDAGETEVRRGCK
jgi:hypothetical protein